MEHLISILKEYNYLTIILGSLITAVYLHSKSILNLFKFKYKYNGTRYIPPLYTRENPQGFCIYDQNSDRVGLLKFENEEEAMHYTRLVNQVCN